MTLLVLFTDVTRVVAISTFSLLFYYTLANVSAFRLRTEKRVHPRIVAALGAATCLIFLAFALFTSTESWLIGAACLIAGVLYYAAKQRLTPP
jgi:APA family basic amino acid/polyamine antiporter